MTPMTGSPFSTKPMLTLKWGTPSINSFVPSKGSTTHTLFFSSLSSVSNVSVYFLKIKSSISEPSKEIEPFIFSFSNFYKIFQNF